MEGHNGRFEEWPHKPIRVQLATSAGFNILNMDIRDIVFMYLSRQGVFPIITDKPLEIRVIVGIDGEWVVAIPDV